MPAAMRISRWRRRKACTRSATLRPASAKNNRGTAAPTANDERQRDRRQSDRTGCAREDDGDQHRPCTRHIQHAQCQAQSETTAARAELLLRQPGERLFQQGLETGEDQPEANCDHCDQRQPPDGILRQVQRDSNADAAKVTVLKLSTRPAITRYGRDDWARDGLAGATATAPAAAGTAASARALWAPEKQDHREHRQDARRDARDEAADEADGDEGQHVSC